MDTKKSQKIPNRQDEYLRNHRKKVRKRWLLGTLTLFLMNQLYWYRGNFHQEMCLYESGIDFYSIGTSPPFVNARLGSLTLNPDGFGLKTEWFWDTAGRYEKEDVFKWSRNMFGSQGVLSLHNGDWSWTVGNITPQCWAGLKRYINKLETDNKPTLIEE